MLKRITLLLFTILLAFSCGRQSAQNTSSFAQIKKLTYSRNPDIHKWTNLFKSIKNKQDKFQFVLSAGQTRMDTLFPLLQSIFNQSQDDSLRSLAVFSMAQVAPDKSTNFFLELLTQADLKPDLKQKILVALGFANNPKSLPVLQNYTRQDSFKENAFYALGKLARSKHYDSSFVNQLFDSTRVIAPSAGEAYYLYYVPLNADQISKLLKWLPNSDPAARLFLLKKLAKFTHYSTYQNFPADSAHKQILKSFLLKTLPKGRASWHELLPELSLTAIFSDSVLFALVQDHLNDSLPAVRLQALKALAAMDKQKALPLLVDHFSALPLTAEKALTCQLITKLDPSTGYLLINQNLDKGNSYFKALLLKALGQTKFPLAIRMLHQFLQIDDPILIQGAYYSLKQIHRLRNSDALNLLNSGHYSVAALVLSDWFTDHQLPDKNTLLHLFKRFRKPGQFELQLEIASLLEKQNLLTSADKDTLFKYLAHPFVARQLADKLKVPFKPKPVDLKLLPDFLHPDSLHFNSHPIVQVKTNKGLFVMELFPEYAPLTVKNFLHLSKAGFYNKLFFHRVIPDFVVQGGDPTGTGWSGGNYLIPSEHSPLSFVRGTVGIATSGFDTGGSQFFICHSQHPHLDGNYTAFGKVIKGMAVVDKIEQGDIILNIKRIQ